MGMSTRLEFIALPVGDGKAVRKQITALWEELHARPDGMVDTPLGRGRLIECTMQGESRLQMTERCLEKYGELDFKEEPPLFHVRWTVEFG